jgi:trans-aconitate methyltransferase
MSVPTHAARSWIQRWDRQQEHYLPDREQRFTVIADIVTLTAERLRKPDPVVLDIGCGPGSLSARIRHRLPLARVIGVDSDPLLLGLANANYPWLELLDTDLRNPQWTEALPVPEVDAVVSTTALHWLQHAELSALYANLAGIIRSGGVFVNGDWMPPASSGEVLGRLVRDLRDHLARRAGVIDREDWAAWWDAVNTAPELAELVAQRGARPLDHLDGEVGFDEQVRLLRELGFAEVAPVWQFGPDRILVGIR